MATSMNVGTVTHTATTPAHPADRSFEGPTRLSWTNLRVPLLIAAIAVLCRIPFINRPLGADEGGYLMVASQWRPGTSTYGNYFVDRPPLLMWLYHYADAFGGAIPLRLLGMVAVAATIVIAGLIARRTGALLAAVFLTTPLFDGMEIDGEILALPFIMTGLWVVIESLRTDSKRRATMYALAGGALAGAAVMIKQNMVDVGVLAVVIYLTVALRGRWRDALRMVGAFTLGGVLVIALNLLSAWMRGTSPADLWEAIVVFRAEAGAVISAHGGAVAAGRFTTLLGSLIFSGFPLVVGGFLLLYRRGKREIDLRWAALAVLVWEATGALLGGSYWPHYLLALIPGLVLLTAATQHVPAGREVAPHKWRQGFLTFGIAVALISATVGVSTSALIPTNKSQTNSEVTRYLQSESRPGDTGLVAFGRANLLYGAGLQSPYSDLWSLPTRVHDPKLAKMTTLMAGKDAPTWIIVHGTTLSTWGIDATTAQRVLESRYSPEASVGPYQIYRLHQRF